MKRQHLKSTSIALLLLLAPACSQLPQPAIEQPKARALHDAPFNHSIKSRSLFDATSSYTNPQGDEIRFVANEVCVDFADDATGREIEQFLSDYKLTIKEQQERIPPGEAEFTVSDGPAQLRKAGSGHRQKVNSFLLTFDAVEPDFEAQMDQVAQARGFRGSHDFKDRSSAYAFYVMCKAHDEKAKYKLKFAGINNIMHAPSNATEGYTPSISAFAVSKSNPASYSAGFWHHKNYNASGGVFGNQINYHSGGVDKAAWGYTKAYGVMVAVVDNGFLNSGESVNTQMTGYPNYYAWNFDSNNSNIGVGGGHGRAVSSLIFHPVNDSVGNAGLASQAYPVYCQTTGNGWNQKKAIEDAYSWGARVIHLSYVAYANYTDASAWPVTNAIYGSQNAIFIAPTGNDGYREVYPTSFSKVVPVSAHDALGDLAKYGSGNANTYQGYNPVVYAGGYDTYISEDANYANLRLGWGTSLSAPLVTATTALLMHQGKVLTTAQAVNKIWGNGVNRNSVNPSGVTMRILDVNKSLTSP